MTDSPRNDNSKDEQYDDEKKMDRRRESVYSRRVAVSFNNVPP